MSLRPHTYPWVIQISIYLCLHVAVTHQPQHLLFKFIYTVHTYGVLMDMRMYRELGSSSEKGCCILCVSVECSRNKPSKV